MKEFADHLGIKQSTISMWYSGQNPSPENVKRLSEVLGPEVYDVLGLDRPDPDLAFIEQQWQNLTPQARRAIRQQAEQYAAHNESRRVHRKPRTRPAD